MKNHLKPERGSHNRKLGKNKNAHENLEVVAVNAEGAIEHFPNAQWT
jgi:hypothetical protein